MGGDEKGRQEACVRLANVSATNATITKINLCRKNLIGFYNVPQWGNALTRNKTLPQLSLVGVGADIKDELKAKTKGHIPDLYIG